MGRPDKYDKGYASVTQIIGLGSNFEFWHRHIAKIHPGKNPFEICDKIKKESQDIGHRVHDGIEQYLSGVERAKIEEGLTDQERQMLNIVITFCNIKDVKPTHMEKVCYSHKYEFAGTFDAVDEEFFYDWKTDSQPKCKRGKGDNLEREIKYGLQLGGYSLAYEEESGKLINKGYVIRASKKIERDIYYFDDLTEYRKNFLILRDAYKILKRK